MVPRLRVLTLCALGASACSYCLGGYFGAAWGGMAAFFCCFLLFACAFALRPDKSEAIACILMGGVFGVMHTLGYSYDTLDSYRMIMKSMKTMVSGALCILALSLVAGCVCLLLIRLLNRLHSMALRKEEADARDRKRLLMFSAAIIFLGSVPYLLLYAPGLNIYDTHDQILQFFGYPSYIGDGSALSDHHPVFLTLVYGGFMKLGLALGNPNIGQLLYSVLSMAGIALCWAYALCVLYDCGLTKKACMSIAAFIALYPVFALYAFNMCKDISAAPFVILLAAQMLRLHQTGGAAMKERGFSILLFANALLLMLTRKPSMYALAFAAVFMILCYKGVRLRLCAVLLGAVALFQFGYNGIVLPVMNVIPGETREMLSIPFQQTARYLLTYPDDVTQEEMDAVSAVLDIENGVSKYDPRLSDPVKDTSNPNLGSVLGDYVPAWISMGLRHPGVYLDAWLNMIYGYFYPSDSNTIVCLTLNSPDQGGVVLTQDQSLLGARRALHDIIYFVIRKIPGIGMLFYVNTVTWAFLFLLAEMIRRGGLRAAVPWMFFFGTLGICMLSPKSGEIRYLMPILYALPVMLGAALLCGKREGENKT